MLQVVSTNLSAANPPEQSCFFDELQANFVMCSGIMTFHHVMPRNLLNFCHTSEPENILATFWYIMVPLRYDNGNIQKKKTLFHKQKN